jgi:hypothetical protein
LLKKICEKYTSNIILNGERMDVLSLKSGTRQGFQHLNIILELNPGQLGKKKKKDIKSI